MYRAAAPVNGDLTGAHGAGRAGATGGDPRSDREQTTAVHRTAPAMAQAFDRARHRHPRALPPRLAGFTRPTSPALTIIATVLAPMVPSMVLAIALTAAPARAQDTDENDTDENDGGAGNDAAAAEPDCQCPSAKVGDGAASADAPLTAQAADHLFEGRVARLSASNPGQQVLDVAVVRSWKGAYGERLQLQTATSEDACGYPFVEGQTYLVFASSPADHADRADRAGPATTPEAAPAAGPLPIDVCAGTMPIEGAGNVLSRLGAGVVPVDPSPEGQEAVPTSLAARPARGGCAGCRIGHRAGSTDGFFPGGGLALFGILGLPVLALRRRRTR